MQFLSSNDAPHAFTICVCAAFTRCLVVALGGTVTSPAPFPLSEARPARSDARHYSWARSSARTHGGGPGSSRSPRERLAITVESNALSRLSLDALVAGALVDLGLASSLNLGCVTTTITLSLDKT
ncbi:hypothetical protein NUW54_g3242 [Trametes sanguinea]|uniref:Uncharacterized protein n=1 Tax=Trametes sanguinea TaxID=158606 RepID=A0ACC1Q2Z1_9APHY|nr:hypothetical protein NUW54_g3242 [Trametes sanguinea]